MGSNDTVTVIRPGGGYKTYSALETVAQVREAAEIEQALAASVNGAPASNDTELKPGDIVTFAAKEKGAI